MTDKLLTNVIDDIPYELFTDVLIKPLPTIKVTKEVTRPKFVEGSMESTETETTTEEVDALFQTGIVLIMPESLKDISKYTIGDTVIFPRKSYVYFDLYKDTIIVKSYDIIGKLK